jgi:hypothetical protein
LKPGFGNYSNITAVWYQQHFTHIKRPQVFATMDPVHYHFSQHKSLSYHEAPELTPEFYSKGLQDGENAIQTWVRVIFCRPAQVDHISPPMEGRKVMVHTHRKALVVGYEWLNPWGERVTSWHDEVRISNLPGAKSMRDWRRHSKCLNCFLPAVGRIQDDPDLDLSYDLFLTKRSLSTVFNEGSTHLVEETSNASDEMDGIETTSAKEGGGIILPGQAATFPAKLSDALRVAPFQSLFPQNDTKVTAKKQDEHATDTAVLMTPSISQQSHVSAISLEDPVAPNSASVPAQIGVPAYSKVPFIHDNRRAYRWTVASVFPGTEASQVFPDTGAVEPPNHGQASPSYLHNAQPYIEGAQPYLPYLDVSMSREDHFAAAPMANEMRKKSFPPDLNWMNEWHEQDHVLLEPDRSNPDSIVLPPIRDLLGNIYHARRRPPQFRLRGAFPLELTPWKAKNKEGSIFQGPGYTDCSAGENPMNHQ